MASNMQDTLKELLISTLQGAGEAENGGGDQAPATPGKSHTGARVAAGVGAAALAPVAVKGLSKLAQQMGMEGIKDLAKSPGEALQGLGSTVGDSVGSNLGDKVSDKVDEAGGASGILADTVKNVLPFGGGGDGGGSGGLEGVGKGRRMPVQQSIDIGVSLETAYNQFTQFEDWSNFMHRVIRVTQEDDCTVTFAVKIWTRTREFTAKIDTQRPDERIKWKVSQGMSNAGVVTFHELGPNLTRVLLDFDVQPGGMIEKMARGMRHVKRASRADLHRFKAYIEMLEKETGAWRGVIEDGEVVEEHDPAYDEQHEYADADALDLDSDDNESEDEGSEGDQDQDDEKKQEDEQPQGQRQRRRRASTNGHGTSEEGGSQRGSSSRGSSSARSSGGSRSSSRSSSSRSSSGNGGGGRSGSSRSGSGSSRSGSGRSGSGSSRSGSSRSGSGGSASGSGGSRRASSGSSSGRRSRSRGSDN